MVPRSHNNLILLLEEGVPRSPVNDFELKDTMPIRSLKTSDIFRSSWNMFYRHSDPRVEHNKLELEVSSLVVNPLVLFVVPLFYSKLILQLV